MENDKEVPIEFPSTGLNVATSYGQQPKNSTPTGVNVRSYESILNRGRGGSRSGLSKYPPGIVPSGAHLIQHMNVVVDPQGGALLAGSLISGNTEPDPDPRWGGRLIRVGGDGIQLNRNVSRRSPSVFIQSQVFQANAAPGSLSSPQSMVFGSNPVSGRLLFVVVATNTYQLDGFSGPAHPGIPTNGSGATYTALGSISFVDITYAPDAFNARYNSLSAYYLVSTGAVADQTVKVDPGSAERITIAGCEYATLNGTFPYDNSVKFTDATGTSASFTTGAIALSNTAGELVLAVAMMGNTDCSGLTLQPPGYTVRVQGFGAQGGTGWLGIEPLIAIMDKTGVQATTITPTATLNPTNFNTPKTGFTGQTFCAIGAGFKK